MKRSLLIVILASFFAAGFISDYAIAANITVATFADPSPGSGSSLFTAKFGSTKTLTGGWSGGGLTLNVPGHTYNDVKFAMPSISLTPVYTNIYTTGSGTINFFDSDSNPLFVITFDSGMLTPFGFGSNEMLENNVTIASDGITGTQGQFAFAFANLAPLPGGFSKGFTATSSFSASAMIPEPATICLLSLCALSLIRRKK